MRILILCIQHQIFGLILLFLSICHVKRLVFNFFLFGYLSVGEEFTHRPVRQCFLLSTFIGNTVGTPGFDTKEEKGCEKFVCFLDESYGMKFSLMV
jgi:hypothetical protein